jgi:hypothetical protein
MKNKDFRALMAYANSARLDRQHKQTVHSKRTAKGAAKHVGVALKNSRVYSLSAETLRYNYHSYKSINPNSSLGNQAS